MNKLKIIIICLLISFFALMAFAFLKIKHKEEYRQKAVLAREIHKVLEVLMFDIYHAREGSFKELPADGLWHNRIAFDRAGQGALEYNIDGGHLWRTSKTGKVLIADNIGAMRIRRQKQTPDIMEVQIEAHNNASLVSNFKIRIYQ